MLAAGLAMLKVVLPPAQKNAFPAIVGAVGKGILVTETADETKEVQPLEIARTV